MKFGLILPDTKPKGFWQYYSGFMQEFGEYFQSHDASFVTIGIPKGKKQLKEKINQSLKDVLNITISDIEYGRIRNNSLKLFFGRYGGKLRKLDCYITYLQLEDGNICFDSLPSKLYLSGMFFPAINPLENYYIYFNDICDWKLFIDQHRGPADVRNVGIFYNNFFNANKIYVNSAEKKVLLMQETSVRDEKIIIVNHASEIFDDIGAVSR